MKEKHNMQLAQIRSELEEPYLTKADYQFQISSKIRDPDWDTYLANTPGGHHVQTSLWAQVKASLGWRAVRILVTQEERIVAGVQLLIRQLPLAGAIGYAPKGPVIASDDPKLAELILNELHQVAREHRVRYLILQPPDNGQALAGQLLQRGFQPSSVEAFPTATVLINLEQDLDEILAKMKSKTRYNIRLGIRKGIIIREGTERDLTEFYRLLVATSQRQNFPVYSEDYYSNKRNILSPFGHFKLFIAEYKDEAVSTMFAIPFGDTVLFKRGGWSGRHGNRRPNEVMHWTAIQWAKSQGYRYYNFEGIDPDVAEKLLRGESLPDGMSQSVTRFKLGFGGDIVLFPGVYDFVYNPILRWTYNSVFTKITNLSAMKNTVNYLRSR